MWLGVGTETNRLAILIDNPITSSHGDYLRMWMAEHFTSHGLRAVNSKMAFVLIMAVRF